jgi:hypothetical protein
MTPRGKLSRSSYCSGYAGCGAALSVVMIWIIFQARIVAVAGKAIQDPITCVR